MVIKQQQSSKPIWSAGINKELSEEIILLMKTINYWRNKSHYVEEALKYYTKYIKVKK